MIMTPDDYWLYQNQEYIEAHERLLRESQALIDLLEAMAWKPSTSEERECIALQSAKDKAARAAVRELRECLMAVHSVECTKKSSSV